MLLNKEKKRKISLFTVFLTFFADNLGWAIVFPIFAPLFIDQQNLLFSADVPLSTRTAFLGVFLAAYPLAQFFGAPILGDIADRYGRKKALAVTVFLTAVGYFVSAWSIFNSQLVVLFISRLFTGIFAGNLSICLAAIVDYSQTDRQKTKYFNYFSALAGFSFIAGSFLGGKFSDQGLNPLFTPAFPLIVAAVISFLNFIFVIFGFEEKEKKENISFDLLEGFHNVQKALKTKKIKPLYLMYFFFAFSWTLVLQFTPVLVINRFSFSFSEIGDISAYMGVCWAVGSIIVHFLTKKFSSIKVLEFCLWVFMAVCLAILIPVNVQTLIAILGLGVAFAGMAWPLCTDLISSAADKRIQGKILGMSQSMLSLAMFVSPIVAGLLDRIYWGMPFLIAALFNLLAALVYFSVKKIEKKV